MIRWKYYGSNYPKRHHIPWCDRVWEARVGIQVSKRELHTHIHLDYAKIEFLSCIKKNYPKREHEKDYISSWIIQVDQLGMRGLNP